MKNIPQRTCSVCRTQKNKNELLCEIDKFIDKAKNDTKMLEKIYKILKCLVEDI